MGTATLAGLLLIAVPLAFSVSFAAPLDHGPHDAASMGRECMYTWEVVEHQPPSVTSQAARP
jgi:hypothetical protein